MGNEKEVLRAREAGKNEKRAKKRRKVKKEGLSS